MVSATLIALVFVIGGVVVTTWFADWVERVWHETHPPDDGTKEVRFDDEDPGE